jgi:general L-amino acid transport system permease protein
MSNIGFVRAEMLPEQLPPNLVSGPLKWVQENLFSSWLNAILTLVSIVALYTVLMNLLPWIWHGSWTASSLRNCREIISAAYGDGPHSGGACWAVITERYLQLMYGFYPSESYWRPNVTFLLMMVALAPVLFNSLPRKMLWFSTAFPFIAFWLLWGGSIWLPIVLAVGLAATFIAIANLSTHRGVLIGVLVGVAIFVAWFLNPVGIVLNVLGWIVNLFTTQDVSLNLGFWVNDTYLSIRDIFPLQGLLTGILDYIAPLGIDSVESPKFGGFMLSIIIGITGIVLSLPLGILLALGRQSDLLIVKAICVGFIEFIRGVPLITLLFVASTLLNYFLPPGTSFDIILRVVIMVTLFASAYMAEVIRGGLAALPKGQYEAADALGLDYWKATRLITMPQALKISIPGIVSSFIGLFKDTTLVSIIGLMDPIGLSGNIRADSNWNGIVWELYGFIALMFFIFCFSMSRYSMYLERKLKTSH